MFLYILSYIDKISILNYQSFMFLVLYLLTYWLEYFWLVFLWLEWLNALSFIDRQLPMLGATCSCIVDRATKHLFHFCVCICFPGLDPKDFLCVHLFHFVHIRFSFLFHYCSFLPFLWRFFLCFDVVIGISHTCWNLICYKSLYSMLSNKWC